MKKFNKSDLTIIDGLLVSEETNEVVVINPVIVEQANHLETMLQQATYLGKQPEAAPEPSLDGFKRKSIYDNNNKFTAKTPLLDAKSEETLALMDELDDVATVAEANETLQKFDKLMSFAYRDFVFDRGGDPLPFDTPTLGNVLELTPLDIMKAVGVLCGMQEEGMRVIDKSNPCIISDEDLNKINEMFDDSVSDSDAADDAEEDIQ